MKELTKKLIESGIVDRMTTRLFEKWGALDPDELTKLRTSNIANETVEEFVEELELLLQPEAIERQETRLDPPAVIIDRSQGD